LRKTDPGIEGWFMVITILVIDSSTNHKTNIENVMNPD
jgi:hypothetical protein